MKTMIQGAKYVGGVRKKPTGDNKEWEALSKLGNLLVAQLQDSSFAT